MGEKTTRTPLSLSQHLHYMIDGTTHKLCMPVNARLNLFFKGVPMTQGTLTTAFEFGSPTTTCRPRPPHLEICIETDCFRMETRVCKGFCLLKKEAKAPSSSQGSDKTGRSCLLYLQCREEGLGREAGRRRSLACHMRNFTLIAKNNPSQQVIGGGRERKGRAQFW